MGPTKRCNTCGEDKPSSGDECAFNKKAKAHDGLQSKCRVCSRKATREHYENNKSYYVEKAHDYRDEIRHEVEEIKKRPCQDCKRSFPPCCMSFIHRDGETNTHIISALAANGRSRDLIMDEMSKCDLVCANCERIDLALSASPPGEAPTLTPEQIDSCLRLGRAEADACRRHGSGSSPEQLRKAREEHAKLFPSPPGVLDGEGS